MFLTWTNLKFCRLVTNEPFTMQAITDDLISQVKALTKKQEMNSNIKYAKKWKFSGKPKTLQYSLE